jgi:TetR/AcrR family transcriptional regulator, tetracycline repressor protein
VARARKRTSKEKPRHRRLSRQLIVNAAIAYLDQHGNRSFTMRDIGNVLGVEAMSLYRYVTGREDLLEAVITTLLDDVTRRLNQAPSLSWQAYLQTLAQAFRQIAIDHPQVFPLIATRHPAAPWLRPPLRSLEVVQNFLETLSGFGLSDEQVVQTYRTFSSFLLGSLLLEAAQRGAQTAPVEEPPDEGDAHIPDRDADTDLEENPTIRHFRALLSEDRSAEEFEDTMAMLLDRLEGSAAR